MLGHRRSGHDEAKMLGLRVLNRRALYGGVLGYVVTPRRDERCFSRLVSIPEQSAAPKDSRSMRLQGTEFGSDTQSNNAIPIFSYLPRSEAIS